MAEKRSNRIWWVLGISLVLGIPFLMYLYIGGQVVGEEFSPDDFSRRRFSYNVVPFLNVCISGIEYRDQTSVFAQNLLNDGYLREIGEARVEDENPSAVVEDASSGSENVAADQTTGLGKTTKQPAAKRWHLVEDSASNLQSRDFDAKLLVRFLDLTDSEYESIWIIFNEDYPGLADEFWPIVADMARNYLYVELTEIMARATKVNRENISDFETFMRRHASQAFEKLANEKTAQGDLQMARELEEKSNQVSLGRKTSKPETNTNAESNETNQ